MWPRQNRWPVFCQQGVSAAYNTLQQLIANHRVLSAQTTSSLQAPKISGDVAMLHVEASQAEQKLAACKGDIVSLIQAMYSQLICKLHKDQTLLPEYESFGDIALAFELPSVYEGRLRCKLQVCHLTCAGCCWCDHP